MPLVSNISIMLDPSKMHIKVDMKEEAWEDLWLLYYERTSDFSK